ncbi:hypothetical protein LTR78_004627 [Recurvomyces mirabilis]|uniref:Uncharacterized protein n=1 Tax=Recurvomyces mirabilis TaxID=574656 RepID=A0AAE0WPE0_9PEZI|nr:hypothetical protein LTR78_004627 [Recurvomyces mirabilis]
MADPDVLRPLPAIAKSGTGLSNIDTAPTRSQTNPPEQKHKRSHLHRRLHSNTITGRVPHVHRRNKSSGKESLLSATELRPPISFDGLLGREKGRKGIGEGLRESGLVGRREQVLSLQERGGRRSREYEREEEGLREQRRRREEARREKEKEKEMEVRITAADVARAKALNVTREEELRRNLKQVEELGMSSTRRLDDTYYSILEKASVLRSTVAGLKRLVEGARAMHKQFDDDTAKLEGDTKETLDGFGDFEQQEERIHQLVERLRRSKERTEELDRRLEGARGRVEVFERRDQEGREQRRQRWRVGWGCLVGNRTVLLGGFDGVGLTVGEVMGRVGEEVGSLTASAKASPSEDPYLRKLFDEL